MWMYINNKNELYENLYELIDIILGYTTCDTINCNKMNLPFFIMGMSLGGGIAAIATDYYTQTNNKLKYTLLGTIYIAPMFDFTKPN